MTFARSFDGASIYFETHGEGVPLILSAGMGGRFWAPQMPSLPSDTS